MTHTVAELQQQLADLQQLIKNMGRLLRIAQNRKDQYRRMLRSILANIIGEDRCWAFDVIAEQLCGEFALRVCNDCNQYSPAEDTYAIDDIYVCKWCRDQRLREERAYKWQDGSYRSEPEDM